MPYLVHVICDKIYRGGDARNTYPPAISFTEIREEAEGTPTTDGFRAKPQPKRRAPISVLVRSDPGFGYSSKDPSDREMDSLWNKSSV